MQSGFLLPGGGRQNFYPDGQRKRRNRQPLALAALPQPELKKVLSVIVSSVVLGGKERFAVLSTARDIVWDEEAKLQTHLAFLQRPDRVEEENAFYEWAFGDPSESSLSDYEYEEPAQPQAPNRDLLSVQAMRAACREEFLAWWARRLEKESRKGHPVLRSFPDGPPKDQVVFFDTRGPGEGASSAWRIM